MLLEVIKMLLGNLVIYKLIHTKAYVNDQTNYLSC